MQPTVPVVGRSSPAIWELTGDDPASPVHVVNSSTGTTGNFSFSLNTGQSTAVQNLALFAPDATCQGPGCPGGTGHTETDALTLTFNFTSPSGAGTASDTGTFTAKYALPYLACDPGGDGLGKSDCVQWASASNPIVVDFTDGAVMHITLGNASDWNITPTVQFTLVSGPVPVPAPVIGHGMWAPFMVGAVLLSQRPFGRRRRGDPNASATT